MPLAGPRTVVLVEGESDRVAIEELALRLGRDLSEEGVAVTPIGGAQAIGRALCELGAGGGSDGPRVAGLCDASEEPDFRRALQRAGFGELRSRADLERLGFFVCDADLEDELIRAVGIDGVQRVLAAEGDLASFRIVQRQPAQRDRPVAAQLRRFMGTRSGRKLQYARALVRALDLDAVPRPLAALLAHVAPTAR